MSTTETSAGPAEECGSFASFLSVQLTTGNNGGIGIGILRVPIILLEDYSVAMSAIEVPAFVALKMQYVILPLAPALSLSYTVQRPYQRQHYLRLWDLNNVRTDNHHRGVTEQL